MGIETNCDYRNKAEFEVSDSCMILTGTSTPKLAENIANTLGLNSVVCTERFADNEVRTRIGVSTRGKKVFVIGSTQPPAENLLELYLIMDAAKRGSANKITAVIPYYGYARQDRTGVPGEPIASALFAVFSKKAGARRIITIDLHSQQTQGSVSIPWDNLYASHVLVPRIKSRLQGQNLVTVSPDTGGLKRAQKYAEKLGLTDSAVVFKNRDLNISDKTNAVNMMGEVRGRNVLIVDDIWGTGRSIENSTELLKQRGANKIYVAIAHGLFAGKSLDIINRPDIEEIFVTDSIPHKPEIINHPKVDIVSVAPLIAEAIYRIDSKKPLRVLYD